MEDTTTPGARDGAGDGAPTNPALEQFQRAALEAVQAARAMLDAAESMIRDPAAVEAVVDTVSAVVRQAGETVAGFATAGADATSTDAATTDAGGDEPDGGFERITVE